jgi:hypothetical protein
MSTGPASPKRATLGFTTAADALRRRALGFVGAEIVF